MKIPIIDIRKATIAIVWIFLFCHPIFAAPTNDAFANATIISGFPASASGDTTGATAEPGEPAVGLPPQESIWWRWTAPFTGRIGIIDDGSVAAGWLKVFSGNALTSLTNLISNNLYALNVLNVTTGTTYHIAVDINGPPGSSGPVHFRLVNLPTNDNFADALPLSGEMLEAFGDNSLATLEPDEPNYSAGWQNNSLWWKWTAPKSGSFRVSVIGSAFAAYSHVFTGDTLTNLSLITMGGPYGDAPFDAVAGEVYSIRVVSGGGAGPARVAIYPSPPPNDLFEQRTILSGVPLNVMGTTVGATSQTNEPVVFLVPGVHSVWYQWQATAFGRLNISATNLTGHPLTPRFGVGVFTGADLQHLQTKAGGQDGTSLLVTNGQTYVIGIDGDEGDFRLALEFDGIDVPANDNFANRQILSGASVVATNDITRATLERGEREPVPGMAKASVWYQWTAPVSGYARALAIPNGSVPVVTVYQGKSLATLKRIATSATNNPPTDSLCSFQALAGSTYIFSVDGLNSVRGSFIFGIDLTTLAITAPPANATISAGTPPEFRVTTPSPIADGTLVSVAYLAQHPTGIVQPMGASSTPPFSITPTNLSPGLTAVVAVGTNSVGALRVSPPILLKVRPANDDFAQSIPLDGYQWEISGFTAQATFEKGEPKHGPNGTRYSVWWSWQAPASGDVEIHFGDSIPLRKREVAVYTGATVDHLTRVRWTGVTNNPDAAKIFHFNAIGGTLYHIAVAANNPNLDPGIWPFYLDGALTTTAFATPLGDSFTEPVDIPLLLNTSESNSLIQQVDFFASDRYTNNRPLGSATTPPFQLIWSNAPPGDYTLEAHIVRTDAVSPPPVFTTVSIRPLNDNFSNSIVLRTNFSWLSHRIAGATREPGEPAHNGNPYTPSTWWTWTAPANGKIFVSDPTQQTSAGLALYTGRNLLTLQPVSLQPDPVYATSQEADVLQGMPYQFAVSPGDTPDANLQLRFYPPPPNDNFSNRTALSGSSVRLAGYSAGATREAGEPDHAGFTSDHTVWWSWTAPQSGAITLQQNGGLWVLGAIYTGTSLDSLQTVTSFGSLLPSPSTDVTGGTTYQIALVSYWGDEEHIGADLNFVPTGTNDNFAGRFFLDGTNIDFTANNHGASTEAGEPPLATGGSGHTLWWSWTAPAAGNAHVISSAGPGSAQIEIFEGDSLNLLQPLPGGGREAAFFRAISNHVYQIRFDSTAAMAAQMNLTFVQAPTNDNFVDASILSGTEISQPGTLRGSSAEPGDPAFASDVWYSWTAPQSGSMIVAVTQGADDNSVQAFTGDQLNNLVRIGTRNHHDSVCFNAIAGTTYRFAVTALTQNDFAEGFFRLILVPGGVPSNDNFANAAILTGTNSQLVATNWAASLEPGDPPIVDWFHLQRTLWYRWQAPASGLLLLTNAGSTVHPVVGTYLGTNLSDLAIIGDVETSVRSQETINILIDGDFGVGGVLRLGLQFLPAPTNDDYQQATLVTGQSVTLRANVYTATGEYSNPGDRGAYVFRDVWWLWTAPFTGPTIITNLNPGTTPSFSVSVGDSFTNHQIIAYSSPFRGSSLQFDAVQGVSYHINGTWSAGGNDLALELDQTPSTLTVMGSKARRLPDGNFAFEISGPPNSQYQIEYSADLSEWQPLQIGVLTNGIQTIIDAEPKKSASRFYRVKPR